jgi:hypothetical protein
VGDANDEAAYRPPMTLRRAFLAALRERRAWLPVSFYMLLAIPVVLLLGLPLFRNATPARFAMALSILFIFFGIVLIRAIMDIFEITRRHYREHRAAYAETVGDAGFVADLGARVRRERSARLPEPAAEAADSE